MLIWWDNNGKRGIFDKDNFVVIKDFDNFFKSDLNIVVF